MAVIDISDVTTLPHAPEAVAVTANAWRVVQLHPSAVGVSLQCKTAVEYGILPFLTIDTDGPDDGDVSSGAGDYDLSACFTFAGAVAAADRPTPSIPLGAPGPFGSIIARPKYIAISSTSSCTVLVTQLGGDQ